MKHINLVAFGGLILSMSFLSCENTSVEQDMSKYCDCRKKLLKKEVQQQACLDIQNEISVKYEFDPEALDQIKKEIKKCNRDINEQFK